VNVETSTFTPGTIQAKCPKCEKTRTIQGITWAAIGLALDVAIDEAEAPVVEELCAQCSYRAKKKNVPMTEEQKAKRAEYNKNRRNEIKAALEFMRANNPSAAAVTDSEDADVS
jgi:hypothetical protein